MADAIRAITRVADADDAATVAFLVGGVVPAAELGTGSSIATKFLRGDNVWATPAGSGGGTVNSVALTMPTGFSVANSPVTDTGTLAVSTTLSGVLKGTGSGFAVASPGSDYLAPTGSGAGLTSLNGDNVSSGTVGAARLGSGTSISSKYLRGDNTWQTIAGSGTPGGSTGAVQWNDAGALGGFGTWTPGTGTLSIETILALGAVGYNGECQVWQASGVYTTLRTNAGISKSGLQRVVVGVYNGFFCYFALDTGNSVLDAIYTGASSVISAEGNVGLTVTKSGTSTATTYVANALQQANTTPGTLYADFKLSNHFAITLATGANTIILQNLPSTGVQTVRIDMTGGTSGSTVSFSGATISWGTNGAPTATIAAGTRTKIVLESHGSGNADGAIIGTGY